MLDWLKHLELDEYSKVFSENGIDLRALPHLTELDLKELGVLLGHRRVLLAAIETLGTQGIPQKDESGDNEADATSQDTAEHRQVTILFADLVGYTQMSAELDAEETCSLFRGPFRGVFTHVVTFALGTLVGAFVLHFAAAHTPWNPRFWYSTMLAAGVVATLNGVYVEFELARDMRSVRNEHWAYRSGQTIFQLKEVVLFALATLPVSIMAALPVQLVVATRRPPPMRTS